jgi:hypothetical protein
MQFWRFLHNPSVTAAEMGSHAAEGTAARVAGRDIVAIQDTTQVAVGGRRARANGYGPIGKGGGLRGLLLHAVLAVDADSGALLGAVDLNIWNRTGGKVTGPRSRPTMDKESQRWIAGTVRAGEVLATARGVTSVSDREGDIYEHFAARPANVDLLVRCCQDRNIKTDKDDQQDTLFAFVDDQPEQGRLKVTIPAAPGRKARETELAVRYSSVEVQRPARWTAHHLPETIPLSLVEVRETSNPQDAEPIHWRLLTTHAVASSEDAQRIVGLYRLRWTAEEYFRTLKTAGFNIEDADIEDPEAMIRLVAAVAVAGVTVMQLVRARDGTTAQPLSDAFDPSDNRILEAVSRKLEGKTARQKNPHPPGSLAFASWVLARLGGWTGYYGKPGPQVMRRGLEDFQRIRFGAQLGTGDV